MPSTSPNNTKTAGFTLVELLAIAPIIILAIGGFIGTLIYMTGDALATRANNTMIYEVQSALDTIEQDVRLSGAFLPRNSVTLTAPQGSDNNVKVFDSNANDTGNMLILNAVATTKNPRDASRAPVYLTGRPYACNHANVKQNQPLTYNIVYFVKDNALWRRTLMPANYASGTAYTCSTPWQLPSCAPSVVASAAFCKVEDTKLVSNVPISGFKVKYYTSPGAAQASSAANSTTLATRQDVFPSFDTAEVTISASGLIAGRTVSQDGTLRVTRIGAYNEVTAP